MQYSAIGLESKLDHYAFSHVFCQLCYSSKQAMAILLQNFHRDLSFTFAKILLLVACAIPYLEIF